MKKSIAKVGYFNHVEGENGIITYDNITWLESAKAGGREYAAEPTGELAEVYADGMVVYSSEENTGYNIKLTLLDIIDDISDKWLGLTVSGTAKSVAEYANAGERPYFGLVLLESTTTGEHIATYYYNCQVTKRPTEKGKTTEGKFEAQFAEVEISARPRVKDTLVKYKVTQANGALTTAVPEPTK